MKSKERGELNHWLEQKKRAEKQIEHFTVDPVTHEKYAVQFKKEVEFRISKKYPTATSYKRYEVYQQLRHKLHDYFGYDTPMMTHDEYIAALRFIEELGY